MTDNAKKVLTFLKAQSAPVTQNDIVAATGISASAVTGSVTGLTRAKPARAVRTEQTETVDGKEVKVKYISLTDEGRAYDPDATKGE